MQEPVFTNLDLLFVFIWNKSKQCMYLRPALPQNDCL